MHVLSERTVEQRKALCAGIEISVVFRLFWWFLVFLAQTWLARGKGQRNLRNIVAWLLKMLTICLSQNSKVLSLLSLVDLETFCH